MVCYQIFINNKRVPKIFMHIKIESPSSTIVGQIILGFLLQNLKLELRTLEFCVLD